MFPPIESASADGLLALGGDLSFETLTEAYSLGIFPWPISIDAPLTWFSPDPRGILQFKNFHTSRSFKKFLKKTTLTVSYNQKFEEVIRACATVPRNEEAGTWISEEIIQGYLNLFNKGYAYSVEVNNGDKLVGGLYGVCFGELISGESMFHYEANASKLALYSLIKILSQKDISWIDTQMVSPLLESMGGESIPRIEFKKRIIDLKKKKPIRSSLFTPERT